MLTEPCDRFVCHVTTGTLVRGLSASAAGQLIPIGGKTPVQSESLIQGERTNECAGDKARFGSVKIACTARR